MHYKKETEEFVQILFSLKKKDFERLSSLANSLGLSESKLSRNLVLDNLSDVSVLLKFAGPFLRLGSKK